MTKNKKDTRKGILFVWCGQQDLSQDGDAKPREISALLRPSVRRGSDTTPWCHSLPRPFKPCRPHVKNKKDTRKGILFVWCGQQDLNLHSLATIRTWILRVCQFRHARILALLLENVAIITQQNPLVKRDFSFFIVCFCKREKGVKNTQNNKLLTKTHARVIIGLLHNYI